jgi:hypothetical protein
MNAYFTEVRLSLLSTLMTDDIIFLRPDAGKLERMIKEIHHEELDIEDQGDPVDYVGITISKNHMGASSSPKEHSLIPQSIAFTLKMLIPNQYLPSRPCSSKFSRTIQSLMNATSTSTTNQSPES